MNTRHTIGIDIAYIMSYESGIINEENVNVIFDEMDSEIREPIKGYFDLHQVKAFIKNKLGAAK